VENERQHVYDRIRHHRQQTVNNSPNIILDQVSHTVHMASPHWDKIYSAS